MLNQIMISKKTLSAALVALAVITFSLSYINPAYAADGTLSVNIFVDQNHNSANDFNEVGAQGITVNVFDTDGNLAATAPTDANGVARFDMSANSFNFYRVEVDESTLPAWLAPAPASGLSDPFVVNVDLSEGTNQTLNVGVHEPSDFCNSNPLVVTGCYAYGSHDVDSPDTSSLVGVFYDQNDDTPVNYNSEIPYNDLVASDSSTTGIPGIGDPIELATNLETGSIWGEAWNPGTQQLFTGAFAKQFSDYGASGPNAIYSSTVDPATGAVSGLTTFADLGALGLNVCGDNHGNDLALTGFRWNVQMMDDVGTCAIGDIDFNYDFSELYVVNIAGNEVVALDSASGGLLNTFAVPTETSCSGTAWPFALEYNNGNIYVGSTCDATGNVFVHEIDPATGATAVVLDNQGFGREVSSGNNRAWVSGQFLLDNVIEPRGEGYVFGQRQDWLTDIEFDNEVMWLGLRDRTGDIMGGNIPNSSGALISYSAEGTILCASDDNADGVYEVANGTNTCGNRTSPAVGAPSQEFFVGDGRLQGQPAFHAEISSGGLQFHPTRDSLVFSAVNPSDVLPGSQVFDSGGLAWASSIDTSGIGAYNLYFGNANDGSSTLRKANGVGDVEFLCSLAPVEIGDFVWFDADGDGVQDPDEAAIVGATVNLYDAAGNLLATTTTDSNGHYYFSSLGLDGEAGTADDLFAPGDMVFIRMDNPDDYAAGGVLEDYELTVANADSDDNSDSDGVEANASGAASGVFPEIAVSIGGAGQNNHAYDFGFIMEEEPIVTTTTTVEPTTTTVEPTTTTVEPTTTTVEPTTTTVEPTTTTVEPTTTLAPTTTVEATTTTAEPTTTAEATTTTVEETTTTLATTTTVEPTTTTVEPTTTTVEPTTTTVEPTTTAVEETTSTTVEPTTTTAAPTTTSGGEAGVAGAAGNNTASDSAGEAGSTDTAEAPDTLALTGAGTLLLVFAALLALVAGLGLKFIPRGARQ